ncbi:IS110 family transposase [Clostridium sp. 19966]|uniref:IS110 family transposase n=1 Tax=Clostridium sp. 19966 TaxID=2768166 RepID=UPI0028DEC6E4|nr:IS110 family transposase [Clostridium sp. 19966]MDT8719761.1 IS110 family transposase [Clostridium sp. 19966]
MEVLYKSCCGLDVHKKIIVACIINDNKKETKSFGAMTEELLELIDWIKFNKCEAVAMESTGVFWKPIYNLLELENIKTLVVNAKHIKAVPGRKTDVKDSEWIADLLKHGLLRGSFIPSRDQRELRELVRYRRSIISERSREISRIQKILQGANIKLDSVASNILGVSGRHMIEKIIEGNTDCNTLAELAKGKLKNKIPELKKALNGLIADHQKMILKAQLKHIDFLSSYISSLNEEIENRLKKSQDLIQLIDEIPSIAKVSAEEIISEIGTNMDQFPSEAHISAWAGLCPSNNESAGKRKSASSREGNKHLRSTLVECAHNASLHKNSYFYSQYHRIAARRGPNKAAIAVAHSMLIVIYNMIKNKQHYNELGIDYFDKKNSESKAKKLAKKIEALGYSVTIQKAS